MNEPAKLIFSAEERLTIRNTDFFQHKRNITDKIFHSFGSIVQSVNSRQLFRNISFPAGTDITSGKISKGENYLGLPYIILDFPRKFSEEGVFAMRTMLWWGNFLSCTLLLSGNAAEQYRPAMKKKYSLLKKNKLYICINESPWHHHFGKENFVRVSQLSEKQFKKHIAEHPFIKIAARLPVSEIQIAERFVLKCFTGYRDVLAQ